MADSHQQVSAKKCRCPVPSHWPSGGANPIAIIVPCHRVVGGAGLGGYSGGLQIKRFLLEVEGAFDPPHDHA